MQHLLRVLRYIVFALFIVSNSVVASLGVWNRSLSLAVGWESQIDLYLIFLGCFGLMHIFTVIFVELVWKHGITGRVWFESSWTGLFWLLYLAGAVAVTVIAPSHLCQSQLRISVPNACLSVRVLLAFTWLMAGTLLVYFSLLVIASILQLEHDPQVFDSYIHRFPWREVRRSERSAPGKTKPPLAKIIPRKMPSIVAPQPRRPAPAAMYSNHVGLSADYEIEPYSTPVGVTRHALHPYAHPALTLPQVDTTSSLYPQFMSTFRPELPKLETSRLQPVRSPEPTRRAQLDTWNRPQPGVASNPNTLPGSIPPVTTTLPSLAPARRNPTIVASLSGPRQRPYGPRQQPDGAVHTVDYSVPGRPTLI